ncbi:MAG: DUF1028 domain-containing protein, partial [Acidimicrobiia bacterium]|nr:DUF1028 domain-containing protein [Acidimicrobiia bacterium]
VWPYAPAPMTYSVVMRDPDSGAYGVAVQSHWFNVSRTAPWVRFGVGAVATQALTDPSYGWRGLDLLAGGADPGDALAAMLATDPDASRRQVALLAADGRLAVHTGPDCIARAEHATGDGWAVLGNLLANDRVIPEMAAALAVATGTLAERMVTVLEAGELAGGDLRGKQSAAVRVVPSAEELAAGYEAGIDISVPDHAEPIRELRRLVEVDRAYRALRRAQTALQRDDETEAREQLTLAGDLRHGVEVDFWAAMEWEKLGESDRADRLLWRAVETQPAFGVLLERLADPIATRLRSRLAAH